jgi:hypothetical protein
MDQVVLSYPADLSGRARERVGQAYYRTYLRRTLGDVSVGDEVEEFVDVGCCGSKAEFALRVEEVTGEGPAGADTEVEYVERAETGAECGWTVQNES